MIARRIHFVWIGGDLPDWAEFNVREFARLNPGHQVVIHGEESILPELAALCAGLPHPSSKADLVRLSVLAREGGWYFDLDYLPLRPCRDAENAWALDGRKVFLSRQNHKAVPINNCVMACGRGAPGIRELIDAALATPAKTRCSYGPDLVSAVYARKPGLFTVAEYPWFMPVRHAGACEFYQLAIHGDRTPLMTADTGTGGQMPFALHLWLNGNGERISKAFHEAPDSRPYALVEDCEPHHPIDGLAEGLANCGFLVDRYRKEDEQVLDRLPHKPAVTVTWNNVRRAVLAESASRHRVTVLWCENGFFSRKFYMQVDHEGFLHRSSWARNLGEPAPADGAERLKRFYPDGLEPMYPREGGYVLVLGQVPNDTQMAESELCGPLPLQQEIARAMPAGVPTYFRPHPSCKQNPDAKHHTLLPELVPGQDEHREYLHTKAGAGLAEALSGARFCVAINSNAIVDALAAGVPSLAFGPHLGIAAGAIRRATLATLAADIDAMLKGWRPEQAKVQNFMEWLAARQWTREELSTPEVVRGLLAAAGVEAPGQESEREERHGLSGMQVAAG